VPAGSSEIRQKRATTVMEEDALDLRVYAEVILRRWRLLILGPIIGGASAFGLTLALSALPPAPSPQPVYRATTVLLMGEIGGIGKYPDLVKTGPVLNDVINTLGLPLSVQDLRPQVSGALVSDTDLLKIDVTNPDPAIAVSTANGVAESVIRYVETLRELQLATAQQELSSLLAESKTPLSTEMAQSIASTLTTVVNRPFVVASAEVLQPPITAPGPSAAYTTRDVILGAIFGGVAAVAGAFLLEYLQSPIRSPAQIERRFGLTYLGTALRWGRKARSSYRLAMSGGSSPTVVESINQVAASIEFAVKPRGIKTLAISSPDSGDGRSSLLANLGVALAAGWKDVVLVDADLRRPSLHRYFNLDNRTGLSTLLSSQDVEIADVLQPTPYQRLRVITSGPAPTNPMALLRCPRMGWLLEQLRESADLVLIDTPPVLATADALVLASQVEGVVLVASHPNSRMEAVRMSLASLEKARTPILGFIWNRTGTHPFGYRSRGHRYYRNLPVVPATLLAQQIDTTPTQQQRQSEPPGTVSRSRVQS